MGAILCDQLFEIIRVLDDPFELIQSLWSF